MTADSPGVEQVRKEMAAELRRYARQASEAAGSFTRWSVYLETDPQAAVMRMRKVLTTEPTDTTSPFLPIIAERALAMLNPAAIEECRQRRAGLDEEAKERRGRRQHAPDYWEIMAQRGKPVKSQDGNVVSVEFGGSS